MRRTAHIENEVSMSTWTSTSGSHIIVVKREEAILSLMMIERKEERGERERERDREKESTVKKMTVSNFGQSAVFEWCGLITGCNYLSFAMSY
jgi:hypothetical protein